MYHVHVHDSIYISYKYSHLTEKNYNCLTSGFAIFHVT